MSDDVVHLHTHSTLSAFDGLGSPKEFAQKAAELGQKSLSLTEHGSIRGMHDAAEACEAASIQYIPGIEMYLADDASLHGLTDDEKADLKRRYPNRLERAVATKAANKARRERDHITVWATNQAGLRNLLKLTWWSWSKGFYFKPRVDLNVLAQHQEGLAVSSGCPSGVICSPLRQRDYKTALQRARFLAETFGDRFVVELMPHVPTPDCEPLAGQLVRLAADLGATVVATQDAHYPHEGDAVAQESLLCCHTRGKDGRKARIDDPDRFRFHSREFWLKSRAELELAFARDLPSIDRVTVRKALDATVTFAERCTAKVEDAKPGKYLAAPPLPEGVPDYDAWLLALAQQGAGDRLGPTLRVGEGYLQRLEHELRTIKGRGFSRYFCATWEVRAWARAQGIFCGPGRGSAGGSLICYLLRITDVDPVKYGLSFDRFLSPGRQSLPDADCDFEDARREEVVDHLRDLYGHDHVSHIATHNRLGGKATLRDLGRIFSIPPGDVEAISPLIHTPIEEEARHDDSLSRVLQGTEAGRKFASQYPDAAEVAGRLEGQLRAIGVHASGIVASSVPLHEIVPMETARRGDRRVAVTAYDMHGVEKAGLVKLDVLGLTTLTVLKRAFQASGASQDEVDLEDPEALAGFTRGQFAGIFQFDTPGARRLARGFDFKCLHDVAVMTALNRPGPAKTGLAQQYVDRVEDPSLRHPVHPAYDNAFDLTLGVPIYQEHVVALALNLGYSPQEADTFRRKVSKKEGLSDEEPKFCSLAEAAGMNQVQAMRLFGQIVGFASYAFSINHAVPYGALAMWAMWLKVRYPGHFYAAALEYETDPSTRLRLAAEARRAGLKVSPPDANQQGRGWVCKGDELVGDVAGVKGIGPMTAGYLAQGAPYRDLADLYDRTAGQGLRITSRTIATLAEVQALRGIYPNQRFLAENSATVWEAQRRGYTVELDPDAPTWTDQEATARASALWPMYVGLEGRTAFDDALDSARRLLPMPVLVPGDDGLHVPGGHLMLARTAGLKLFADDRGGGMAGRASLTSADGDVTPCRVDADVLDRCAELLGKEGRIILALAWTGPKGGAPSVDLAWPLDVATLHACPVARFLTRPDPGKRDPGRQVRQAQEGALLGLEGVVARRRLHRDKNNAEMATVGLLGDRGYTRLLVFASRWQTADRALIKVGQRVTLRVKALGDGSACLSDAPIRPA